MRLQDAVEKLKRLKSVLQRGMCGIEVKAFEKSRRTEIVNCLLSELERISSVISTYVLVVL